jgi:hypothetical protein
LISEYPNSRIFFNIAGGSLTLLSVQLPWITLYGMYPVQIQAGGFYAATFYWALAGALVSFISRYGGVMTLVGMLSLGARPYELGGSVQPASGILLAIFGAVVTFAGVRWSIPRALMRGREIVGGALYSVGFLTILVLVIDSILQGGLPSIQRQLVIELPLLIVGALVTGLGLRLFLSPEKTETSLRALNTA